MDHPRFEHRPTGHPAAVERLPLTEGSAERSGVRTGNYDIAVAKQDRRVQRLAETSGTRDDRVQHGLDVRGAAADDAQHLRGSRLLLQRLAQLARARFEFLFQLGAGLARPANARSHLRSFRTKTANAGSALRPFARQVHLFGTVDRPMLIALS
jgi:hypothetical protein